MSSKILRRKPQSLKGCYTPVFRSLGPSSDFFSRRYPFGAFVGAHVSLGIQEAEIGAAVAVLLRGEFG